MQTKPSIFLGDKNEEGNLKKGNPGYLQDVFQVGPSLEPTNQYGINQFDECQTSIEEDERRHLGKIYS